MGNYSQAANNYSRENLSTLVGALDTKMSEIKKTIQDEYSAFVGTCRENWRGVDETSFEELIKKDLGILYESCSSLNEDTCYFMTEAVRSYEKFQSGNAMLLDGGGACGLDVSACAAVTEEYTKKSRSASDLEYTIAAAPEGDKLGLLNDESGSKLIDAAQTLKTNIETEINTYKDVQGNSKVFTGSQSSEKDLGIDKLLETVKDSMNLFVADIDKMISEYVPTLVSNYVKQSDQTVTDANSAGSTMKTNVETAVGGSTAS